jgi:hypothetical protein
MSNYRSIRLSPKEINISLDDRDFQTLKDMCDDAIRYRQSKNEHGVANLYYCVLKNVQFASFQHSFKQIKHSNL